MTPAKGDTIRVRRGHGSRARLAVVTAAPTVVGRFTLVPFAYARQHPGDTVLTLSRVDHVAQLPTDSIEVVE